MKQVLLEAIALTVAIAQPLISFSIGVETGGPQLKLLFARLGLNARYFLATFVVMPAIAIALGALNLLPQSLWVGLALMSMAPPAPPASRKLRKSGNAEVGLAWQAEAFVLSALTIPLTVVAVARLGLVSQELNLTLQPVFVRSLMFFVVPICLGLLLRRYLPAAADALVRPVTVAATAALLILAALVLVVAVPVVWRFGVAGIVAVAAFVALAIVVGHAFGGPGRDTRVTLAAMLAARFPVPALVLAQANGATKSVLPVVLVYVIAGMLLMPLYERLTAPRSQAASIG